MASRTTVLATNEYYHVLNRGVEQREIFRTDRESTRFIELLRFYRGKDAIRFSALTVEEREHIIASQGNAPLVEVVCYCLMPNHFHLLLKQVCDGGIRTFMQRVADAYSKYFNNLHRRVGPLFQGNFKAIRIKNDTQLLHVSRYIHLNPMTASLATDLTEYQWSSIHEYLGRVPSHFCHPEIVLGQFRSPQAYQAFVLDYADYARTLHQLKHALAA